MYLGQTKPVENKNRKFGAADGYVAVYLQIDTTEPTAHLFTPTQLNEAKKRADDNKEDIPALENKSLGTGIILGSFTLGILIGVIISLIL